MNQSPMKIIAGIRARNQKMKSGTSVRMREEGKKTMYAPNTPDIAPLAPSEGMCEPHVNTSSEQLDPMPQTRYSSRYPNGPSLSSVLPPKIQRNHMLPMMCIQPPWRNMHVNSVSAAFCIVTWCVPASAY